MIAGCSSLPSSSQPQSSCELNTVYEDPGAGSGQPRYAIEAPNGLGGLAPQASALSSAWVACNAVVELGPGSAMATSSLEAKGAPTDVAPDPDGGGYATFGDDTNPVTSVVAFDAQGNTRWQVATSFYANDYPIGMYATHDGVYLLYETDSIALAAADGSRLAVTLPSQITAAAATSDALYIAYGQTLLQIASGATTWSIGIPGTVALAPLANGGIGVMASSTTSAGGWAAEYNSDGTQAWAVIGEQVPAGGVLAAVGDELVSAGPNALDGGYAGIAVIDASGSVRFDTFYIQAPEYGCAYGAVGSLVAVGDGSLWFDVGTSAMGGGGDGTEVVFGSQSFIDTNQDYPSYLINFVP